MPTDTPADDFPGSDTVSSRAELISFAYALSDYWAKNPESLENKATAAYLAALAQWLGDADGYYRNFKLDVSTATPSWRMFADCLAAAGVYDSD